MEPFARLLESLITTPSRNAKLDLLSDYFATTPDPDRGWAVAAMTGDLDIVTVKPALLRRLTEERVDAELFRLSYDYVGDLAETISLIWPPRPGANHSPSLDDVVTTLTGATKAEAAAHVTRWFDALEPSSRWALGKLMTGGLRIGVAARLVKLALAKFGERPVAEIEELWHGLTPPYTDLFAWLDGTAEKPENAMEAPFRPVMLAHPVQIDDQPRIELAAMAAEWKWDGIRVQAVREGMTSRLYTRTGDDISATFPDVVDHLPSDVAIDGELLVFDPGSDRDFEVRPFGDLQQRLNRKTVSSALLKSHPAFIRAYDLLWCDGEDLRTLPFSDRRARLEERLSGRHTRIDLSPLIPAAGWDELDQHRSAPPHPSIEGVMLKRQGAPYLAGRPKGEWWKWKRDPFLVDCVLMYAQRGHGKRSGFYSDYTFGVWREPGELVPVGKAYHGFTDAELKKIDKFVRDHTIDRFGPVRSVSATPDHGLVLEIAFEGLQRSTRHKSGVAMRFPRVHRLRWDKQPADADNLSSLEALLPAHS